MKFNNPIAVFDLETTKTQKSITEIGITFLTKDILSKIGQPNFDPKTEPLHSVSLLVCPKDGDPIGEFEEKLCGFTQEQLEKSYKIRKALDLLGDCVKVGDPKNQNSKQWRLMAWGTYFDMPILRRSYNDLGIEFPFSGTALCAKSISLFWASLSGHRTDKGSLETFANYFGISPESERMGDWHRARVDAVATARVFLSIAQELASGVYVASNSGKMELIEVRKRPD